MSRLVWGIPLIFGFISCSALAAEYPAQLKLDHPDQRVMPAKPGLMLEAMQRACPETMLTAAPATEARNITEQILRTQDSVIIETEAELVNVPVGAAQKNLPVTYRCEYRDGRLTLGIWERGMVGKWTLYDDPKLDRNALGTPWPE